MYYRKSVECPVCKEYLGFLAKDELCSFICQECKFIFSWDKRGELLKPVKLDNKKPKKCSCGGCQMRGS